MAREDFTDTVGVLQESGHPGFADYSLVGSPEHLREFLAALQKGLEVAPKREMVSVFQGGEPTAETVEVKLPQVSLLAADLTGGRDLGLPRFGGRVDCVTHLQCQRPSVWAVGAVGIAKRFPRTLWAARPFAPSTGPAASTAPLGSSW